jgi:hypothetical protein
MRELAKRVQRFIVRDPLYRPFNAKHRRMMAECLARVLTNRKLHLPVPPFPPKGFNFTAKNKKQAGEQKKTLLVTGEQEKIMERENE